MLLATKLRRKPSTRGGYKVRLADRGDVHLLPQVELSAARRFMQYGYDALMVGVPPSNETLERRQIQGRIWVATEAGDVPVGFATASIEDRVAHLDDLHVLPAHGSRGLGTELIEAVCGWAVKHGARALTLSTLLDVPWNAPFYLRRGFRILDRSEWPDSLSRLRELERGAGLPVDHRVMMLREVR
jgi:GNAT superfamily N-acetyltransferase